MTRFVSLTFDGRCGDARLLLVPILALSAELPSQAQCPVPAWLPGVLGTDGAVLALTTWDPDGSGPSAPQLVAGGSFTFAGEVNVNRIARWDQSVWQPFGTGMNGVVLALTTWDTDGTGPSADQIVAGGFFTTADGITVNNIARWDGSAWQPFGSGMISAVRGLTTWDPDGSGPSATQLVAGGSFVVALAGLLQVNHIARWNGSAWQPFGAGMNGEVDAVTTWDADGAGPLIPEVVAGGYFTTAGGAPANRIAGWDGSAWHAFGTGMGAGASTPVLALTTWDRDGVGPANPELVAGGFFTTAGGAPANRIARWDGSAWQPFGTGMGGANPVVFSLTTWDPDGAGPLIPELIAAGRFLTADGVTVNNIARYDGSLWHPFGSGTDDDVHALTNWDPDGAGSAGVHLAAGGVFTNAGEVMANHIALYPPAGVVPGDGNGDCQVGQADLVTFVGCMQGPVVVHLSGCAPLDLDVDSDVDIADFAQFQALYMGA